MSGDTLSQRQYDKGYRAFLQALRTGQVSLVDALHNTTIAPDSDAYNRGANQATEDYIKELER